MRVLLTGHQGYLGTVMSTVLLEKGHDVVGLDSGLFASCVLGPYPVDPPTLALDLRDVQREHLLGFEAVIHLAALSNDPLGSLDPQLTYDINHRAAVRLARLAKDAGTRRFLYASTCSVYGAAGEDLVNEEAPLRPVTPYARSKVLVEEDLDRLADAGFSPVYLRNATAFGFSPRLRADIVLNNLVGSAVLTGEVTVLSDGTPWRPLVHVLDIAEAFCAALTAETQAVHNRPFNIGAEANNLTVAEIAQHVVDAVPGSTLRITGATGSDPRSYRVDFSAIRNALPGYQARRGVGEGAAELVANYRAHGLTEHDFAGRFVRLAALNDQLASGALGADLRRLAAPLAVEP